MKHVIDVTLADCTFPCALRYPQTADYFPPPDPAAPRVESEPVGLSQADWEFNLSAGMTESPFSEYSLLTAPFSDALMNKDRMIVHAVAVRWKDHAYLIAARSGVGKSTQARTLQELRPGEFSIICGDRPVLEFCHSERSEESAPHAPSSHSERSEESASPVQSLPLEGKLPPKGANEVDSRQAAISSLGSKSEGLPHPPSGFPARERQSEGEILVHPSPWNGKENWHGAEAAPLAGLILLRRDNENALCPLTPRQAAIPFYTQVIQTCLTEAGILQAAELTTRLLNSVPIWQLTSYQIPDSTKLLLQTLFQNA